MDTLLYETMLLRIMRLSRGVAGEVMSKTLRDM